MKDYHKRIQNAGADHIPALIWSIVEADAGLVYTTSAA